MDWKTVLSEFVQVFLMALAPILAGIFTAWAVQQFKLAKGKLTQEQLYWLELVANTAVKAAEQAKLGGYISDKREYAFELIEQQLKQYGYTFDLDVIYAAIEAAVMDEFNRAKQPAVG